MFFNFKNQQNKTGWDKKIELGQLENCTDAKIHLNLTDMKTNEEWIGTFKEMPHKWLSKKIIKISNVRENVLTVFVN